MDFARKTTMSKLHLLFRRRPGQIPAWWTAALLAVAGGIFWTYLWVALSDERGVSAPASSQAHSERGDLALIGWADRSRLGSAGSLRLYLTVENHAKVTMERIRLLLLQAPGLEPVGNCWDKTRSFPICGTHPGASGPLPQQLGPGEAASLWADLRATGAPGARAATALVAFTRADTPAEQQILGLSVGPIEQAAAEPLTWARALLSFVKDLALPLMLALLAYAFQRLQQEQGRAQETFNLTLPQAHENAVKHLLPVVGAADQFLARFKSAAGPPSADQTIASEQCLFFLLSAAKGMRDLVPQGGGIFLSDLVAEDATAYCWRTLRYRLEKELGQEELPAILDLWSRKESFTSMREHFFGPDGDPAFQKLKRRFEKWLRCPAFERFDSLVLRAFDYIMQREIDRLYWTWYGQETPLEPQAIQELLNSLPSDLIDAKRCEQLKQALVKYLASNGVKWPEARGWGFRYRRVDGA